MARLIPKISMDEILSKPERDVARALIEQLPKDCIVYHSYPWLRADRNDKTGKTTLCEGEADFVVVIPELGFLILEVKGGTIEYDSENHLWYRLLPSGQSRDIKNPFEQAQRSVHYLKNQIVRHSFPGQRHVPCAFGHAVVLPDCTFSGPMPPGAENSILFSINDLPFLDRRIPEALRKWSRKEKPQPLSKKQLNGIIKGLSPSFQLLPVLFRRIEEQEERLVRLTDEQKSVLDVLHYVKRATIEGVAGSGKTLLALAQAQRFADQGQNTLLICYNRALSNWLENILPRNYKDTIKVSNFHRLCREYCIDTGIPFEVPQFNYEEEKRFWKNEAANLFVKAIDRNYMRFDAVVVDEGQDFFSDWWVPLELINLDREGAFYLFYDPFQNLYVDEGFSVPNIGEKFSLRTNCRNTVQIAKTCSQIRGINIEVNKFAPIGEETIVEVAAERKKQLQLCRKFIGDWLDRGKLKPSQIAIQSLNTRKNSSLSGVKKIHNVPITENLDEWKAGKGVFFSTIRSFKGLEADAVIIIDVPGIDSQPHFSQADLYVACSRAKHLLVVLPISEGVLENTI